MAGELVRAYWQWSPYPNASSQEISLSHSGSGLNMKATPRLIGAQP